MAGLHECFEKTIEHIGFADKNMPTAVFYNAPVGIRFEIGGNEDVYLPHDKGVNPIYAKHAFHRAKTLFDCLPCRPNLLRIDIYPEDPNCITLQTLPKIGLSVPDEFVKEKLFDEDSWYIQEHLYWDLTRRNCQIDKLLMEIIKGDIGGFACLCSNVYFVNTECNLLYHLYDDRGTDIVAKDKKILFPLYQKYNDWILQHDRAAITRLFSN